MGTHGWYEELLRDFFSTCFVKDDLFLKFDLDMLDMLELCTS